MQRSQTTSLGLDLLVDVRGPRRRAGLAEALRDAIRSGRLAAGTRLPASRVLAADLGLARSTVTECYAELVAEGWLTARQGSGTRVAERTGATDAAPAPAPPAPPARDIRGLAPGAADFAEFPRAAWLAAARRALAAAPHTAFGYGDPAGAMPLRVALADYLGRVRGVRADPALVVICAGFHDGLGLLARALRARGVRAIATEAYGLDLYRDLLAGAGLAIPPLRVDADGARTDELAPLDAGAALVTPAHQFPLGVALSPERRAAALDWARATDGVIVEDDYDGEFRYDRAPIGALQAHDPDHVVYVGTASKSIAPAVRIGWMVVPPRLLPDVLAAKGAVETVGVLDQLTLADFVAAGDFDRHVRGRRQAYRRRRDQLVAALADAPGVRVLGMAAGLQAALALPTGAETPTVRAAAERGLVVSGLAGFRHPELAAADGIGDGIVVNFSAVSDSAWPGTLELLRAVLGQAAGEPPSTNARG